MDSDQILLNMYKKQEYDATRDKMQKMVIIFTILTCLIGTALSLIFHMDILYTYLYISILIFTGVAVLLYRLKAISLNTASLILMLYFFIVFTPINWYLSGIFGNAPFISFIILAAGISMFTGKTQKLLFYGHLAILFAAIVYSVVDIIPVTSDLPSLIYAAIAYIMAIALVSFYMISKQKKFEQMSDHFLRSSFKDELTRLFNRKVLDIIMQYEESLYKEEKSDYILIMFDVDKFKKMNDERGHVFGDIVLRNIAKCINEKVRSSDFVVRYGGDEFLVVQTNATDDSLHIFIDRIKEAMKSSCYLDIKVSVSYGFAARSECETSEEVLALADKRLYENKEKN